ncbi:stage II sporulation protein M [Paraclostridium benzoelyticum]|nr:stage II sporulation protein M [Paraclostridium benzoelyticum]
MIKKIKKNKEISLPPLSYFFGYIFGCFIAISQNLNFPINPKNLNALDLIIHNSSVIGILALGILSGGIITLFILFLNGAILGVTIHGCINSTTFTKLILLILPHGIFEIPSFIIAGIGDLYIVSFFAMLIHNKKNLSKMDFIYLKKGVLLNIIALILIIIAGFIESYI